MLGILFAIFLIVPLIEVSLFIFVGGQIGVFPTLALCVVDAIVGAFIVRHQGLATLGRLRDEIRQGHVPAMEIAEGAALFASGSFLITPGFFTDTIGLLLLVPPARRAIIKWLFRKFAGRISTSFEWPSDNVRPTDRGGDGHTTIEIQAEDISDEDPGNANPDSPWHKHDD